MAAGQGGIPQSFLQHLQDKREGNENDAAILTR